MQYGGMCAKSWLCLANYYSWFYSRTYLGILCWGFKVKHIGISQAYG
jgi:hypothetical protein